MKKLSLHPRARLLALLFSSQIVPMKAALLTQCKLLLSPVKAMSLQYLESQLSATAQSGK